MFLHFTPFSPNRTRCKRQRPCTGKASKTEKFSRENPFRSHFHEHGQPALPAGRAEDTSLSISRYIYALRPSTQPSSCLAPAVPLPDPSLVAALFISSPSPQLIPLRLWTPPAPRVQSDLDYKHWDHFRLGMTLNLV